MRKTSKVISLLLTVAMMITMVLPMTVSAAFSDVSDSHGYYEAITNLSAEGILNGFEDGSFKPGDPVTRAQFTKIICYALSVGDITYSEEERSVFTDLDPNHWAANNIVQAYKQGIINGMGDGTFAPEAGVQYEQAVKMVVCALGYGNRALSLGEYPHGYMQMANQLKILKGITDAKMYQVMNRGAVAQLIDNMRDAEQLQDGQPAGSIRDEISTTNTVEGRVVASRDMVLYATGFENPCGRNEIAVESGSRTIVFDISEIKGFDINEYLGRSVIVYYEDESGSSDKVATNIALQAKKNETVTIALDMIESYGSGEIEYYKSENSEDTEVVTYENTANIFNGVATTATLEELLAANVGKPGTITLISSAKGAADVAFVKSYITMVVNSVSAKDNKIYGRNICADGCEFDIDDRGKTITFKNKNGSTVAMSAIGVGSVLSIAASDTAGATAKDRIEASKIVEVIVCTDSVRGTIEATVSNPRTIKIAGKNYEVADGVYGENASESALTVGAYVSVGLDAFGQVAKFTITEKAALSYGYISALEHGTNTKPDVRIMVYKPSTSSTNPTGAIYALADRVQIDEDRYEMDVDMYAIIGYLEDSATVANTGIDITPTNAKYSQPIRFTTNSAGKVDKILTVRSNGDIYTSLEIKKFTSGDGINCKADGSTLGQYKISGVPVIYVPANRTSDDYSTKSSSFFKKDTNYYVQLANINTNTNAVGAIYLYGVSDGAGGIVGDMSTAITEESKPMIVVTTGPKLVNGEERYHLRLKNIATGEENDYYDDGVAGTEALADLVAGDIIRIAADDEGNIEKLQVVAIASEVAAKTFGSSASDWIIEDGDGEGLDAEFRILIGTVNSKEGNIFTVVPGYSYNAATDADKVESHSTSVTPYIIDTAANETARIDTGVIGDLVPRNVQHDNASRVLIYMEENEIKALVIFE